MKLPPVSVRNGLDWLNQEWSQREEEILHNCLSFLLKPGFQYWQVPSSISQNTYCRQDISEPDGTPILGQHIGKTNLSLAGSAEQGLLERLSDKKINEPLQIVARNTCFRLEPSYHSIQRVCEFQKVEQFACVAHEDEDDMFEELLQNAIDYLDIIGVTNRRVIDRTKDDPGYHVKKFDIEVYAKAFGWLETHSCSKFGLEQSKRFGITGRCRHTLSNTGIASPRILVPLMEADGITLDL